MRSSGLVHGLLRGVALLGLGAMMLPLNGSAQAAPPLVTVSPTGTKIKVAQATLTEAIDALARAAGFKVTYDGVRPTVMLYNAEIDTPTVAGTLFRLIDGQNLNYALMFDKTGKKVTSLMVLGAPPKAGGVAGGGTVGGRPQGFATPRKTDTPVVEDDPVEPVEPEVTPTPSPSPATPPGGAPAGQGPFPPSPFGPRPPYGAPFGPRPTPSPTPSP